MPSETVEQLKHIFNAEAVALVGASDKEGSFGRLFLEGLRDSGCKKIYPVNPKRDEILGIKAYPSISDVPERLDAAILLTPPDSVLPLVKECVANKVRGAVVFASGFGELGEEGKELEREIGRVGRFTRGAYAYLLVPRLSTLTTTAQKRLHSLQKFSELGSGFKLAMEDLEIRGAGNILGREQHGYIEAVGFDLYCRLLKSAVDYYKEKR